MRALLALLFLSSTALAAPGDVVWVKRIGGRGLDYGWGLATTPRGDLLLGGYGDSPIDLGGGVLLPRGADGIFVAAFDRDGTHRWSRRFPIELPFYAGPLGVTRDGAALLVGDGAERDDARAPGPAAHRPVD